MNENYIKLVQWPGNSSNINLIESLWYILKDEIHEVSTTNKILLIERLIHIWFRSENIKALCGSLISGMLEELLL